jgi:hypothetical protein
VVGCCESGDEPSGSGAMELVIIIFTRVSGVSSSLACVSPNQSRVLLMPVLKHFWLREHVVRLGK